MHVPPNHHTIKVFYGAVINVVGTFLTPVVARQLGSLALVGLRFLMGCGQGILVPCMNVLIAHWFPMSEKSTAIAIATTGNQVGGVDFKTFNFSNWTHIYPTTHLQLSVIAAMFLTAELCQFEWLGGWASAFYTYGFVGVAFCVVWLCYVSDTPSKARYITDRELRHIHGVEVVKGAGGGGGKVGPSEVPWSSILRSMVVWSTALCSFSQNFMNVGTVVYLPSYYAQVLRMNLSSVSWLGGVGPSYPPSNTHHYRHPLQNGLMSALPFVVQLLTKIVFASIADELRARRLMSPSAIAKLFNLIGMRVGVVASRQPTNNPI